VCVCVCVCLCVCVCVCVPAPGPKGVTRVSQRCYKSFVRRSLLQGRYEGVTRVLHVFCKGFTSLLQGCHKGVKRICTTRVFKGCYKGCYKAYYKWCYKGCNKRATSVQQAGNEGVARVPRV
jgi:hypothetical protein